MPSPCCSCQMMVTIIQSPEVNNPPINCATDCQMPMNQWTKQDIFLTLLLFLTLSTLFYLCFILLLHIFYAAPQQLFESPKWKDGNIMAQRLKGHNGWRSKESLANNWTTIASYAQCVPLIYVSYLYVTYRMKQHHHRCSPSNNVQQVSFQAHSRVLMYPPSVV